MTSEAPTEQGFTLPSQTSAPSKARNVGTPDDPGYVPGVEHDQYGRYRLPEPDGDPGELVPWTRVTTLAGAVTSAEGLQIYTERKIARGFGLRQDVRELMASDPDSTKVQDEALAVAKEAAGVGAEARGGTARHSLLEHFAHTGELRMDESEPAGRDLLAAVRKLEAEGVTPVELEQLVVHEHLNYAGRLDQLARVTLTDARGNQRTVLRILDAKFGKQVTKPNTRHQIGVQLALYANCTHAYDPATRTFVPMPAELDRERGYVLHVHDGRAELHEVDLVTGWQDAKTAILLHQQRRASVTFLPIGQPVVVVDPALSTLREAVITSDIPNVTASQAWQAGAARFEAIRSDREIETFTLPDIPDPQPAPAFIPADVAREAERSPSGRAKRACSKCRKPGHTAKNCPGVPTGVEQTADAADAQVSSTAVEICPHAHGWTKRVSDSAWVCGDCGQPSEATVKAMRSGDPLPTVATESVTALPPAVEGGATVARLDPAPSAPAAEPTPPPWAQAGPTLSERILACQSQEELGQLWQAHSAEWGEEHTTAATARVEAGLPVLAPDTQS